MKHLTTVLVFVLASTNASKYFRPDNQFVQVQQDMDTKNKFQDKLMMTLDDDPLFSKLPEMDESIKWESPRMLVLTDLESLQNLLQDEQEDFRMKRMKTSLSIDNPLDVLRQQYYRALARRMKFKSIEKNREHLIKTGKRSPKKVEYQMNLGEPSEFGMKPSHKDFLKNRLGENERYLSTSSNEAVPTTRRYSTQMDEVSYQI